MLTQGSKNWRQRICYALVGLLIGAGMNGFAAAPAKANFFLDKLRQIISPSTNRGTAVGRSRGGAIRGNCTSGNGELAGETNLVALIPKDNVGKTVEAHPTFWFYVPTFWFLPAQNSSASELTQVKAGEFMLLDDQGEPVLKQPIPVKLANQAGFARFTLPQDPSFWASGNSLQVGKRYNWFFSIVCDTDQPAKNPVVRGWIERTEQPANFKQQLQQVAPRDRYTIYIQNGNWYESLTALAENRQTASESWSELLNQLGLMKAANAPIFVMEPTKSEQAVDRP